MNFDPKRFAHDTKSYLQRISHFGFSGAILIAYQGDVRLREGFSLADRKNRIPNTPETVFSLGSITKQFTAAAVMKLVEMGKLKPEDVLSMHIPDLPEDKASITIHHLLTHTAGTINYTGGDFEPSGREEMMKKVFKTQLAFEPGERYEYSNAGYSLLAALVEIVSNEPYETFLYNHLLKPAGLEKTGYTRPDWSGAVVARWYTGETDHGNALEKTFPTWNIMGNGEILSTLDDMLLWDQALLGDAVLGEDVKSHMYTPYLDDYGYGWLISESPLGTLIEHNGANDIGASALFRRYVDAGLTVVLFCNQSFGDTPMVFPMEDNLTSILEEEDIPLPPEIGDQANRDFEALLGIYHLDSGGVMRIIDQGDALGVLTESQDAINLLAFPGAPADAHQQLNQVNREVFQALLRGDHGPLGKFLNDPDRRLTRVVAMVERNFTAYVQSFGEFVEVEVLGTVPSSYRSDALDTVVALHFERGSISLISITKDGVNLGVAVSEIAQGWVMTGVQMGDELVGYHIPLAQTVRLGIQKDKSGRVTGLIGDDQNGGVVAKRRDKAIR